MYLVLSQERQWKVEMARNDADEIWAYVQNDQSVFQIITEIKKLNHLRALKQDWYYTLTCTTTVVVQILFSLYRYAVRSNVFPSIYQSSESQKYSFAHNLIFHPFPDIER